MCLCALRVVLFWVTPASPPGSVEQKNRISPPVLQFPPGEYAFIKKTRLTPEGITKQLTLFMVPCSFSRGSNQIVTTPPPPPPPPPQPSLNSKGGDVPPSNQQLCGNKRLAIGLSDEAFAALKTVSESEDPSIDVPSLSKNLLDSQIVLGDLKERFLEQSILVHILAR